MKASACARQSSGACAFRFQRADVLPPGLLASRSVHAVGVAVTFAALVGA